MPAVGPTCIPYLRDFPNGDFADKEAAWQQTLRA